MILCALNWALAVEPGGANRQSRITGQIVPRRRCRSDSLSFLAVHYVYPVIQLPADRYLRVFAPPAIYTFRRLAYPPKLVYPQYR